MKKTVNDTVKRKARNDIIRQAPRIISLLYPTAFTFTRVIPHSDSAMQNNMMRRKCQQQFLSCFFLHADCIRQRFQGEGDVNVTN